MGVRLSKPPEGAWWSRRRLRRRDPHRLRDERHGSARFGWVEDLARLDMLEPTDSLALKGVPIASVQFPFKGMLGQSHRSAFVTFPHEGHSFTIGAPGSGKNTAALAPLLLNDDQKNMIVLDPNGGELTRFTAEYRRTLGDVVLIDPLGIFGIGTHALNPFDAVVQSTTPVTAAQALAHAILPPNADEKDPFWTNAAQQIVGNAILHLASTEARATLANMMDALAGDIDDEFLDGMARNRIGGGVLQRAVADLVVLRRAPTTWGGVKSRLRQGLAFLDEESPQRTLQRTTFQPQRLRTARMTVYIVLPKEMGRVLGPWLRLMYRTLMTLIGTLPGRELHVVVDELPSLGRFDEIADDMAMLRKYGVHFHLAAQDLNQLQSVYGGGWQTLIGNADLRRFLGANDAFTAQHISDMLGDTTVASWREAPAKEQRGQWEYNGKRLLTPGEVLGFDRNRQLIFARDRVFDLPKSHSFKTAPWADRLGDLRLASKRRT